MGNNIILETKFVADIRGSFYIPSYQRGYRWSETEVLCIKYLLCQKIKRRASLMNLSTN